jgi:hypothetical protein
MTPTFYMKNRPVNYEALHRLIFMDVQSDMFTFIHCICSKVVASFASCCMYKVLFVLFCFMCKYKAFCFHLLLLYILSRVCGDYYKMGIGLTTGFIGPQTVTVYTLYNSLMQLQLFSEDCCSARILTRNWNGPRNSLQLSLFSCSEDPGSNSATTAATNSYGVPCHYSLTGAAPLSNTELLNCWTRN